MNVYLSIDDENLIIKNYWKYVFVLLYDICDISYIYLWGFFKDYDNCLYVFVYIFLV